MACLLCYSRDSGEGSEKMDLNWLFSTVALFFTVVFKLPITFQRCNPLCVLLLMFDESAESFVVFLYGLVLIWQYYVVYV